ncbi:Nitrogen assimilation transcription factor nit-4 [Colletotrichum fructicola]|nr:Nitrogen assimilation transcription factor nit-4 [Colletotrichum fructicola]
MTRTVKALESSLATRRADLILDLQLWPALTSLDSSTGAIPIACYANAGGTHHPLANLGGAQVFPWSKAEAGVTQIMKPQRELLPAGPAVASGASSERESTPQSVTGGAGASSAPRRRPQTKIACTSCRRRKSKCDGLRPVCSLCAGMGRTKCEYDAGPDVTRFAALKSKHEELQQRVSLFEELFHLLSMRTDSESVEIIRRMRTTNIQTGLGDLVKFIKNADLLIQLASTKSAESSPAPGADVGHHGSLPLDEISSLFESLKPSISKLDATTRTKFLNTIRVQIDALAKSEDNLKAFVIAKIGDSVGHRTTADCPRISRCVDGRQEGTTKAAALLLKIF